MATAKEVETAIRSSEGIDIGTKDTIQITQTNIQDATYTNYYCVGRSSPFQGKAMWVQTTTADSAANQAATILSIMVQDGNSDPNLSA